MKKFQTSDVIITLICLVWVPVYVGLSLHEKYSNIAYFIVEAVMFSVAIFSMILLGRASNSTNKLIILTANLGLGSQSLGNLYLMASFFVAPTGDASYNITVAEFSFSCSYFFFLAILFELSKLKEKNKPLSYLLFRIVPLLSIFSMLIAIVIDYRPLLTLAYLLLTVTCCILSIEQVTKKSYRLAGFSIILLSLLDLTYSLIIHFNLPETLLIIPNIFYPYSYFLIAKGCKMLKGVSHIE